jgi:aspartate racemase
VWVEDQCLRYEAVEDSVTPDLLAKLQTHELDIIAFLNRTTEAIDPITLSHLVTETNETAPELQLKYWKHQLSAPLPTLRLPTDRSRPAVQTYSGKRQQQRLSAQLVQLINTLHQKSGISRSTILLSAFYVLLYRYTGQEDLIVGLSIAEESELEKSTSSSVNTLALRAHVSGHPTFLDVLKRVHRVELEAQANQNVPFEKIVKALNLEHDPSCSPIFQTSFMVFSGKHPIASQELDKTAIFSAFNSFDNGVPKIDLCLLVNDNNTELSVSIEYNTYLFEDATIARMFGHFQTLIEGAIDNPNQIISMLPMLTLEERNQVLVEWNKTQREYPKTVCIQQLIEEQVERSPEAIAVVYGDQQLTYQALNQRANQLAAHLQSLGVGPEIPVALYATRSIEMLVGVLGILKAGAAYIPIDPAHPHERQEHKLRDSQAVVILTQANLVASLPDHQATVILLDTDWHKIAQHSSENPTCLTTPDNLAYVIYTSGSTGIPKGVAVTHRSMVNYCAEVVRVYEITSRDQVLQFSNISFDVSIEEIFPSLISGATIVIRSEETSLSISQFLEFLDQYQITFVALPTAFWHELTNSLASLPYQLPNSLRLVVVGGDKVSSSIYQTWLETVGTYPRWLNAYGPTEATISPAIFDPLWLSVPLDLRSEVPIGRPIANTQLYILDDFLQPVPIGIPGELYIGGVGLARKYLNHLELTKEKFVSHPFTNDSDARLYKTGDLVRYRADGNIEFLGRRDRQVKIRGFRIELGEIEFALSQHPMLQDVVVIVREDQSDDKQLVAYGIPNYEQTATNLELREFLKQRLPGYMIPAHFVLLESFPLTANGKVDLRALPAPNEMDYRIQSDATDTFVASRDSLEQQLTEIWKDVLGVPQIGIQDNFFDLGGNSILAVRLFTHIETRLSRTLPLSVLLKAPTIEQMAALLRQNDDNQFFSPVVEIQAGTVSKSPLFCIHGGGFNVLIYRNLALYLDSDQPIYGLQARGLDGSDCPQINQLGDLAADYIQEIRRIQPQGPYFLAGLSNGGMIALDMAQQLLTQGEQVALLALFDTDAPNGLKLLPSSYRFLSSCQYALRYSLPRLIGKLIKQNPRSFPSILQQQLKAVKPTQEARQLVSEIVVSAVQHSITRFRERNQRWKTVLDWVSLYILNHSPWAFLSPSAPSQDVEGRLSNTLRNLESTYSEILNAYVPQPYPGRILLFRAMEMPPGYHVDPYLGWSAIANDGVDVYKVPGHHTSILESATLARILKAEIEKARQSFQGFSKNSTD